MAVIWILAFVLLSLVFSIFPVLLWVLTGSLVWFLIGPVLAAIVVARAGLDAPQHRAQ